MHVSRHLCYLWQDCIDELFKTVHWANFNQFLTEVIAKLIGHNIWQYLEQILKNTLHEWTGFIAFLKSFLDHTAPSLIKGKDLYLVDNVHLFFTQVHIAQYLKLWDFLFLSCECVSFLWRKIGWRITWWPQIIAERRLVHEYLLLRSLSERWEGHHIIRRLLTVLALDWWVESRGLFVGECAENGAHLLHEGWWRECLLGFGHEDAIVLIQIVRTSLTVERIVIVSTVELEVTITIVGCKAYVSRVGLTRLLARRLGGRLFDLLVLKSVMKDLFGPWRITGISRTLSACFLLFSWPKWMVW